MIGCKMQVHNIRNFADDITAAGNPARIISRRGALFDNGGNRVGVAAAIHLAFDDTEIAAEHRGRAGFVLHRGGLRHELRFRADTVGIGDGHDLFQELCTG